MPKLLETARNHIGASRVYTDMCKFVGIHAIKRHTQLIVAALLSATVVAACGGADESSPDGGDGAGEQNDDQDDGTDDLSPLEQYLGEGAITIRGEGIGIGIGVEDHEPTDEELQTKRDFEERVAQCMADEGFEYIPNVEPPDESNEDRAYALPPEEFAKQYGYGVTTLTMSDNSDENPNQVYRDSLSEQAKDAYDAALHGPWYVNEDGSGESGSGDDRSTPHPEPEDLGCSGRASHEVYGVPEEGDGEATGINPYETFNALMDDLLQLGERIQDDPRVVDANEVWRSCMADAGFAKFEKVGEPEMDIHSRLSDLRDLDEQGGEMEREMAVIEGDMSDIDPEELNQLREYELELAQADYTCKDEHYAPVVDDVRVELESEFVEEHRSQLEQMRNELAEVDGVIGGAAGA